MHHACLAILYIALNLYSILFQEALRAAGRSSATLHVDPRNEAAIKLYTALNFKLDGVLEDYYSLGRPAHKLILNLEE